MAKSRIPPYWAPPNFRGGPFGEAELGRECVIADFPEHRTDDEHAIAFAAALAVGASYETGEVGGI